MAKGLRAKTVIELRKRLLLFAAAERRIANEVGKLKPPKDAEHANKALARGERMTADEVEAAANRISKMKSVSAALASIQSNKRLAQTGRELDSALAELRRLGYTTGS